MIAPKITTNIPYSFNQVGGTSLKLYLDFGNRYSLFICRELYGNNFISMGSNWTTTNATKEFNAAIAPDGTKTATLITEEDVNNFHFIEN